jgi:putative spermidine/putrescine transport system permease protein
MAVVLGEAGRSTTPTPVIESPRNAAAWLLLAPSIIFLSVFFLAPVAYVLVLSVTEPSFGLSQFRRVFAVPLYLRIMMNTFNTSLIVTVACLLLGYPLAYVLSRRDDWVGRLLLAATAMSFWTGFVIRTYAWFIILGNRGVVASIAAALGLTAPQMLFTSFSSMLGMTHILLPFMVFALYAVMRRIDTSHTRAALSLGATPSRAFKEVFLPLSLPGVVNGSVIVFTLCLGLYVTPILLGTPRDMMISQLISQQIEELLAWGFAAALAVVLLVTTMVLLAIYNRFIGLDRLWG